MNKNRKINNKRKITVLISLTLGIIMLFSVYANASTLLKTPLTDPNYVVVGIEGTAYTMTANEILNILNGYRLEACRNGYPYPGNESKKLTMSDYKPLKWSSDLELIARVRAAEADFTGNHVRVVPSSHWELESNGIKSWGEVLAWHFSGVKDGIKQWYDEKEDYIKGNKSAITGHYSIMIDPDYEYVGIGAFDAKGKETFSGYAWDWITVAGEFGGYEKSYGTKFDETKNNVSGDVVQQIEVTKDMVKGLAVSDISLGVGDEVSVPAKANVNLGEGLVCDLYSGMKLTSSDSSVAEIRNGKVYGKKRGNCQITVEVSGMTKTVNCTVSTGMMFRLYNPNSGEHFYTANPVEKNNLVNAGWRYEGFAWQMPDGATSAPVYRLYNKNAGDHHYTTSAAERDNLVKVGWKYEGIGWYSETNNGVPVYRLYNPNATGAGAHHYTTSAAERDKLKTVGWRDEGIGWFGK